MSALRPRLTTLSEMNRRTARRSTPLTAAAFAGLLLVGCATTTIEESVDPADSLAEAELAGGEDGEIAGDGTVPRDDGVPTTVAIDGSAADLLVQIGSDMSRLSAQIADDGDEDATIARIEGGWAAIQDEVEASKPELVSGIQTTVDMARTAVDTNRPADADKAFSLLTNLVDAFTGDD